MVKNNRFKIKTPFGYNGFIGLTTSDHTEYYEITCSNGERVICSGDHGFWSYNNDLIKARDLLVGFDLKSATGVWEVANITICPRAMKMYDIVEVFNGEHSFFTGASLKTHNCQFLTFEKTLVSTDVLDFYRTPGVMFTINEFNIYKEKLEHVDGLLIVTIDPSAGGDDNSVIQVWEIAPHKVYEIASLVDAFADATVIFDKLLWLQTFMRSNWNYEPDESLIIFERNGIGEGLAQILTQTEKAIEELEMPIFYDGKGKPGLHTTQSIKNKLALQFKNLVEFDKMKISDSAFIDELYGFVRTAGGSYSGKSGYKDDRVMCSFLMVYYLLNVFADFAQGDFSVDNMMLVNRDDKIINLNKHESDPAALYRERVKKGIEEEKNNQLIAAAKIEAAKKEEREYYARQAAMGSSIIEKDDDDDDVWDIDEFDILPTQSL